MSISTDVIGRSLPPIRVPIERGRLRFFAEAIGERNPIYSDMEAAQRAGYPDLPVPPTFLFGLKLEMADPFGWMAELGIDLRFILHGSQKFVYHRMAFAGDELQLQPRIADVYERRGGALEFLVLNSDVTRDSDMIAALTETVVIRHPEKEATA